MFPQLWFFVSIAFGFIAWGVAATRYVWPELRRRPAAEALQPLLTLHSFRFAGLAFLVPGVGVTRSAACLRAIGGVWGSHRGGTGIAFPGIAATEGRYCFRMDL